MIRTANRDIYAVLRNADITGVDDRIFYCRQPNKSIVDISDCNPGEDVPSTPNHFLKQIGDFASEKKKKGV